MAEIEQRVSNEEDANIILREKTRRYYKDDGN